MQTNSDKPKNAQGVQFTRHAAVRHGLCALLIAVAAWIMTGTELAPGATFVGMFLVAFVAMTLGEIMASKHN